MKDIMNKVLVKRKKVLPLCLLALLPLSAQAQSDDFGLDFSLEAQKKLSKQWSISLEGELRRRDNANINDRWSLGLGVDYKVAKWLKASAGYTFLYGNTASRVSYYSADEAEQLTDIDGEDVAEGDPKYCYPSYWTPRHRFNVSLTLDKKLFGNFRFSLRERWQYTWRPEQTIKRYAYLNDKNVGKTYSAKGKNVLRSRLQVEYDKKGLAVTPYANVELFNAWSLQKTRYTVGLDWKLSKQHAVGAFYRYQNVRSDDDDNEPNRHMIGVGYTFKF